ncbi:MAG: nucleotidyltransferase family protein [Leptolyngbyaceae cyanobacterium RM1_406_9]|nr:nucleotidyltransferase family protein [Leptolyngbyaceae cyanobacterium RM1_406_9]
MITQLEPPLNQRIPASPTQIADFCQRWHIIEFALFGSVLRNDFRPDSDIDVLVTFAADSRWSLFDWVDMRDELEALFGRKVDIADKEGLKNPYRQHEILRTQQVIYASKQP